MNTRLQILIALLTAIAFVYLIYMIRTREIQLRYALGWLIVDALILVLTVFPHLIDSVSHILGIANPMNTLYFFGFLFVLGLVFILTLAISRNSIRIKQLTQEIALRDASLQESIARLRRAKESKRLDNENDSENK